MNRASSMTRFAPLLPLALVLAGCPDDPEARCTPASGQICTIAGSDFAGLAGDGDLAIHSELYLPMDMEVGPDGRLYIVDWNNHRIRVIDSMGVIDTFAGTGTLGDGPVDVPALESDFNHPTDITFDGNGDMVIAAWHNSRIKVIDMDTGVIRNFAGTGRRAYNGEGMPAMMADLDLPASVAFDADGTMFLVDQANQLIRTIDEAGVIDRFAGQCIIGACDPGEVPTACPMSGRVTCTADTDPMACMKPCTATFAGDGGPAVEARFAMPVGQSADPAGRIAFDADGNLYFADTGNNRIRRIGTDGVVTTIAGTGTAGFAGDGGPATMAELDNPVDVEVGADGTIYVADKENSCVRAIAPDGMIRTFAGRCGERGFAGDGAAPDQALLDRPYGIALNDAGDLYIADTHNNRIRIVPN